MKETNVGLAEHVISRSPDDVLVAYGLGSCLGVVMIDPVTRTCALLHAVLPRSADGVYLPQVNPCKYVENGIEHMVAALAKAGVNPARLIVRIVGGANMVMSVGETHLFDIGTRNIEAARTTLSRMKMTITAAEVGGHAGRTVRVYVAENRVTVRTIGEKEREM